MAEGVGGPAPSARGSSAVDRLLAGKERVLMQWERRLRQEIPAAAAEGQPILIDTLPALLDRLAEALSSQHPRATATEGTTIADEHGGERVRMTHFRLEDVITEYKLLREVLVSVLDEQEPLTQDERRVLHTSLDQAMTSACNAYVLVQEGIREQTFAVLAHDLRGPLAAASTSVALISRHPASEHVPRWAARAADGIGRVDRMLQDLLDAVRVQAGGRTNIELSECDLIDLVRTTIEQLQAQHGDRFELVGPGTLRGYLAPDVLRRALENLASNAVKYGAASRPVTITVQGVHGRALITVHNEGPSIPVEHQETLFRAFHRLQSAEQSTERGWGLGLAQVRTAAEAHGGSIGVDSMPDRGTTFTIDIPLDARPYQSAPTTLNERPR
jgi:signal transduction histidine kinase